MTRINWGNEDIEMIPPPVFGAGETLPGSDDTIEPSQHLAVDWDAIDPHTELTYRDRFGKLIVIQVNAINEERDLPDVSIRRFTTSNKKDFFARGFLLGHFGQGNEVVPREIAIDRPVAVERIDRKRGRVGRQFGLASPVGMLALRNK